MSTDAERWLIEPGLWSRKDQDRAWEEGWCILEYRRAGRAHIAHAYLVSARFNTNLEAAEFVVKRASEGSEFHQRALQAQAKAMLTGAGE